MCGEALSARARSSARLAESLTCSESISFQLLPAQALVGPCLPSWQVLCGSGGTQIYPGLQALMLTALGTRLHGAVEPRQPQHPSVSATPLLCLHPQPQDGQLGL